MTLLSAQQPEVIVKLARTALTRAGRYGLEYGRRVGNHTGSG